MELLSLLFLMCDHFPKSLREKSSSAIKRSLLCFLRPSLSGGTPPASQYYYPTERNINKPSHQEQVRKEAKTRKRVKGISVRERGGGRITLKG